MPHVAMLEAEYVQLHEQLPNGYPTASQAIDRERAIYAAIHAQGHAALCLSGGGIRSASFAIGVMQGLARRGLLPSFDFVSTVSGGGYAGGWLSAWLFHTRSRGGAVDEVFEALAGEHRSVTNPEPDQLRQVREYSNYLDPKVGLFSADVWTLVSTVARNLVLNWLVLIPLLAAALLVPRVYYALTMLGTQDWIDRDDLLWWSWWLLLVGAVLLTGALIYVGWNLPSGGNRQRGQSSFLGYCFVPFCVATGGFTLYWAWSRALDATPVTMAGLVGVGAFGHLGIWLLVSVASAERWRPMTWVAALVSGAVAGFGIWWFATGPFALPLARGALFASVAAPLIIGMFAGSGALFIGMASGETTDDDREWWSRFGAWMLITVALWLSTSLVVFTGPAAVHWLLAWIGTTAGSHNAGKVLLTTITAMSGGVAARTHRESKTGPDTIPLWRRVTFALAAPTFVVLLLVGLASVNLALLDWFDRLQFLPEYYHPAGAGLPETAFLLFLFALIGLLMGLAIAVNKFSLHGMYRNRLIRAFLGAARPAASRRPNLFTGFDPRDNVYLQEMAITARPIHVVNMALNLVAGKRLAWQERKAASFTVSPLMAGSPSLGYRPISEYGGPDGMSLGTAITISGAAASPNMGYHSSPAMTFLLTLFNARLGAWLGSPGPAGRLTWRRSDPLLGAAPLLREMFGRTTDDNPYVYLSDGGHFENLGLYEMVARRCRFIVVSDAGCDADYAFEDLGNAIRKIRIDLGIAIEFPDGIAIDREHARQGNRHAAVGAIRYSAVDGAVADGVLLYLKATLSGDEPIDVRNYAASHPDFPHETTANQWFGESQFESYRTLGMHTVDTLIASDSIQRDLPAFLDRVRAG
ncbi:MAG: patatin-like phospholipase family protein [Vicinamibacterales bacterium]